MSPAVRTTLVGYAFAAVLVAVGWGGPIGGLGIALAGMLTLINAIAFAVLIAEARATARRPDPVESATVAESLRPIVIFAVGTAVAISLVVGSALIFFSIGGFGL